LSSSAIWYNFSATAWADNNGEYRLSVLSTAYLAIEVFMSPTVKAANNFLMYLSVFVSFPALDVFSMRYRRAAMSLG
jgi:hypothetical protein